MSDCSRISLVFFSLSRKSPTPAFSEICGMLSFVCFFVLLEGLSPWFFPFLFLFLFLYATFASSLSFSGFRSSASFVSPLLPPSRPLPRFSLLTLPPPPPHRPSCLPPLSFLPLPAPSSPPPPHLQKAGIVRSQCILSSCAKDWPLATILTIIGANFSVLSASHTSIRRVGAAAAPRHHRGKQS